MTTRWVATNAGRADLDEVRGLARTSGPVRDAESVWAGGRVHPESVAVPGPIYRGRKWFAIDNGAAERAIRPIVGRANWLQIGGDAAWPRRRSLSCPRRRPAALARPRAYLTHVLTELPARRATADLTDLLPDRWA